MNSDDDSDPESNGDNDIYSQLDDARSESESPEMADVDQEDFRTTPPHTPDLCSPADSGVEDCSDEPEDDEEWENIDPRLRPVKRRPGHGVNVHTFTGYNVVKSTHPLSQKEKARGTLRAQVNALRSIHGGSSWTSQKKHPMPPGPDDM